MQFTGDLRGHFCPCLASPKCAGAAGVVSYPRLQHALHAAEAAGSFPADTHTFRADFLRRYSCSIFNLLQITGDLRGHL